MSNWMFTANAVCIMVEQAAIDAGQKICSCDAMTNPLTDIVTVRLTNQNGAHFVVDVPQHVRLMSVYAFREWLVEKYPLVFKKFEDPAEEARKRIAVALDKITAAIAEYRAVINDG